MPGLVRLPRPHLIDRHHLGAIQVDWPAVVTSAPRIPVRPVGRYVLDIPQLAACPEMGAEPVAHDAVGLRRRAPSELHGAHESGGSPLPTLLGLLGNLPVQEAAGEAIPASTAAGHVP